MFHLETPSSRGNPLFRDAKLGAPGEHILDRPFERAILVGSIHVVLGIFPIALQRGGVRHVVVHAGLSRNDGVVGVALLHKIQIRAL